MERFVLAIFIGVLVIVSFTEAASKNKRQRREAEVANELNVGTALQRTKRLETRNGDETLSRVKRLDMDRELKRYKRQKRHIQLVRKALEHVQKRSVSSAELREVLRVKRTRRGVDSSHTLQRVKRGKNKSHRPNKREVRNVKKRSISKRDIQLAKALLRRKRNEHPRLVSTNPRSRTVKKDGKNLQQQKKHHVQRHKKSTNPNPGNKNHKKSDHSQNGSKKSKKGKKSAKELSRVKRH